MVHWQYFPFHCFRILWYISSAHPCPLRLTEIGAFWLAFAATLTPAYNAEAAFLAGATTEAEKAAGIASFEASLGECALNGNVVS
jgi:hypothetical protein